LVDLEEGKGERYLAPGRQYGNALLGVRHQEEEGLVIHDYSSSCSRTLMLFLLPIQLC